MENIRLHVAAHRIYIPIHSIFYKHFSIFAIINHFYTTKQCNLKKGNAALLLNRAALPFLDTVLRESQPFTGPT